MAAVTTETLTQVVAGIVHAAQHAGAPSVSVHLHGHVPETITSHLEDHITPIPIWSEDEGTTTHTKDHERIHITGTQILPKQHQFEIRNSDYALLWIGTTQS